MTRAQDQAAQAATRPSRVGPEDRVVGGAGRAGTKAARPARFRLKRSLELFPASDGVLYLMRSGSMSDFSLPAATEADRLILAELEDGYRSVPELELLLIEYGLAPRSLAEELGHLQQLGLLDREPEDPLNDHDAERYLRQLIYFADFASAGVTGEDLQRRLASARVVVLGTGGLGCWASAALACAGIGTLRLVDDDCVELGNLNRQVLFAERDLGELKVEVAARALRAHDSKLKIETLQRRVRGPEDLAGVIADADLLLATADWPPYELPRWINQVCLAARVPFLTAGQFPPLLRIGPLVIPGESACVECQETQIRRDFPFYDELAAFRRDRPTSASTFGAASGLIGTLMANEAIHLLTGVCRPATVDRALIIDLQTLAMTSEDVARDPECDVCRPSRLQTCSNVPDASQSSEASDQLE